ncbi:glycosyltransferase family 39 protein [Candidatus Curtissbacteria bacterium]|nr:glycosyltransferase family 39 protein [Candidatus Curtissbacteria bacterium]
MANFLYPLPFYAAELPKIIGFSFINSVKIIFVTATIASVIAIYWALKKRYSQVASFVGAVLYLYLPYRFVDLYVRGSIGENLAFVFMPIALGAFFQIHKGKKFYLPILSLSFGLLLLSHNVIALLFVILMAVLIVAHKKYRKETTAFTVLGLLIGAFFWIPALVELQSVRLSQIKVSEISNHLVNIDKLLMPQWGYSPDPNSTGGLSVQLGLVSVFLFLATAVAITFSKKRDNLVLALTIIYLPIVFLMTRYAELIWKYVPGLDVIQFPWRMLAIIVLVTAVFGAFIVDYAKNKKTVAVLLVIAAILSTLLYTKPRTFTNQPDGFYSTNESTTTVRDEYMPLWVKKPSNARANTKIEAQGASLANVVISPSIYKARINADKDINVTVNTIYFPGWQVKSGNKDIPINYQNERGLIMFQLPKGDHDVIIKYNETPVHLLSEFISIAALLATGFFFLKWRKVKS